MAEIEKIGEAVVDADQPGIGSAIAPNVANQNRLMWTSSFSAYYLSCYFDNIQSVCKINVYKIYYRNQINQSLSGENPLVSR